MQRFQLLVLVSILGIIPVATFAQDEPSAFEEATALMARQDWPGAAQAFQAITDAEPTNPTAWFGLGRALFNSRQVDRALEAYLKALELGFDPPRVMIHLARCHAIKGEDTEAIDWLTRAADTGASIYQALESNAEFQRLKSNPTYQQLLARVKPCNTPQHQALDFWVGSWRVVAGEDEQQVGKNSIVKILNGCAIIENWQNANGGEGKSLFYYDDTVQTWKQVWITDGGVHKEKQLIAVYDNGAVRFQGEIRRPDGAFVLDRTTLVPLEENRVRQVIEQSSDGGETWQVGFDVIYLP